MPNSQTAWLESHDDYRPSLFSRLGQNERKLEFDVSLYHVMVKRLSVTYLIHLKLQSVSNFQRTRSSVSRHKMIIASPDMAITTVLHIFKVKISKNAFYHSN